MRFVSRVQWLWLAGIALAMIVAMRLEGRVWNCECGRWTPWAGDVWSEHASQHFLDPYAITHFLHGFAFCGMLVLAFPKLEAGWRLVSATLLEAAWEVAENSPIVIERYRAGTMALGYEGDSILNSVGDLLACAIGVIAAQRWGWKFSIAAFVFLELLLLVWIKDNLTLNVVMLIHPIDAIKEWQTR